MGEQHAARHLTRRAFIGGVAALTGAAILAACGADNGPAAHAPMPAAGAVPAGTTRNAAGRPATFDAGGIDDEPTLPSDAALQNIAAQTVGAAFVGYVSVLTNTQENGVALWGRTADGKLSLIGATATGGYGIGDTNDGEALGSQNALVASPDGRYLYAVNGGSNTITCFAFNGGNLSILDRVSSGGPRPISLTLSGRLLYVLNNDRQAGTAGNITGFTLNDGRPAPLAGSTRALSQAGADPGQVQFSPDGAGLIVPEKKTNRLVAYPLGSNGLATATRVWNIASRTPFAVAFRQDGVLITADANGDRTGQGTASSHTAYTDGTVEYVSRPIANGQTATCWVAVHPAGRLAYTANFLSKTLTGYRIANNGGLSLTTANGVAARANSGTRDLGFTADGRFLYALNALAGTISGYAVGGDGALTPIGEFGKLNYAGANGMVVR